MRRDADRADNRRAEPQHVARAEQAPLGRIPDGEREVAEEMLGRGRAERAIGGEHERSVADRVVGRRSQAERGQEIRAIIQAAIERDRQLRRSIDERLMFSSGLRRRQEPAVDQAGAAFDPDRRAVRCAVREGGGDLVEHCSVAGSSGESQGACNRAHTLSGTNASWRSRAW
jgi:hypothetical protein